MERDADELHKTYGKGFKLLGKLGWAAGDGLGKTGGGSVTPVASSLKKQVGMRGLGYSILTIRNPRVEEPEEEPPVLCQQCGAHLIQSNTLTKSQNVCRQCAMKKWREITGGDGGMDSIQQIDAAVLMDRYVSEGRQVISKHDAPGEDLEDGIFDDIGEIFDKSKLGILPVSLSNVKAERPTQPQFGVKVERPTVPGEGVERHRDMQRWQSDSSRGGATTDHNRIIGFGESSKLNNMKGYDISQRGGSQRGRGRGRGGGRGGAPSPKVEQSVAVAPQKAPSRSWLAWAEARNTRPKLDVPAASEIDLTSDDIDLTGGQDDVVLVHKPSIKVRMPKAEPKVRIPKLRMPKLEPRKRDGDDDIIIIDSD
jgi:hypothetical protein